MSFWQMNCKNLRNTAKMMSVHVTPIDKSFLLNLRQFSELNVPLLTEIVVQVQYDIECCSVK